MVIGSERAATGQRKAVCLAHLEGCAPGSECRGGQHSDHPKPCCRLVPFGKNLGLLLLCLPTVLPVHSYVWSGAKQSEWYWASLAPLNMVPGVLSDLTAPYILAWFNFLAAIGTPPTHTPLPFPPTECRSDRRSRAAGAQRCTGWPATRRRKAAGSSEHGARWWKRWCWWPPQLGAIRRLGRAGSRHACTLPYIAHCHTDGRCSIRTRRAVFGHACTHPDD